MIPVGYLERRSNGVGQNIDHQPNDRRDEEERENRVNNVTRRTAVVVIVTSDVW
jgi:hypothetical protein